jgi:hypothetical protein
MSISFIATEIAFVVSNLAAFWLGRRVERGLQPTSGELKKLLAKARVEGAEAVMFGRIKDTEQLHRMMDRKVNRPN